ncbi:MAG: EamA family transporter [Synechococcaceae cyanobacterium SM2_3_1]|nr:EamA family transporter [Synechococcaceae cyanobacterium SM2_3_1]
MLRFGRSWGCAVRTGSSIWIGYLAISYGIQQIGVTTAFLISAATPILTVLAARIGIAEMLNLRQLFGVILVALGIAILGLSKR